MRAAAGMQRRVADEFEACANLVSNWRTLQGEQEGAAMQTRLGRLHIIGRLSADATLRASEIANHIRVTVRLFFGLLGRRLTRAAAAE